MKDFERFVTGELAEAAKVAEKLYNDITDSLPEIPTEAEINTVCQAAGVDVDLWVPRLVSAWGIISQLVEKLKNADEQIPEGVLLTSFSWLNDLRAMGVALKEQSLQHAADKLSFDKNVVVKQRDNLLAKQWSSQQSDAIKEELKRLKQVEQLNNWMKSANPIAISKKASDVSEKLITEAYVQRFNNELKVLGASRIKVELIKTRASKGKVMHAVRLKGIAANNKVSPRDVLSEGEKRIVELAAFLADVTGRSGNAPFIFDDPISSLDQDFEEKTVDRLIALSVTRQVLVFTHRLSFLGMLCDKSSPDTVCIQHEIWGAGEPSGVPLFAKNPDRALKSLRDERVSAAKKILDAKGKDAYYPYAKAICGDLRILLERIVERVLLADVVKRHRREVHTKNIICQLAKITKPDCEYIEKLMGEYSRYEHSQSDESPVFLPLPDVLKADIDKLLEWQDEFKKRG